MMTATSESSFGESRILSALLLERRFRAHLMWRHRLLYDSRYAAAAAVPLVASATIYISAEGAFELAGGTRTEEPVAYVAAIEEFEHVGAGVPTFRSWGDPAVALSFQVQIADLRVPVGLRHGPIELSDSTWGAVHAIAEAFAIRDPLDQPVAQLLAGLARDGIVVDEMATSVETEPEPLARAWAALAPLYDNITTSSSLFGLARSTGLSLRQVRRDVKALAQVFGLLGAGFRDSLHVLRLRFAALLLSAPEATVGEVAQRAGYKSVDALGRAFRDYGLPAPSVVRAAVLYPG
jgi:AraC-like DNA-binding protein